MQRRRAAATTPPGHWHHSGRAPQPRERSPCTATAPAQTALLLIILLLFLLLLTSAHQHPHRAEEPCTSMGWVRGSPRLGVTPVTAPSRAGHPNHHRPTALLWNQTHSHQALTCLKTCAPSTPGSPPAHAAPPGPPPDAAWGLSPISWLEPATNTHVETIWVFNHPSTAEEIQQSNFHGTTN